MSTPTTIRAQKFGNELGMVTTAYNRHRGRFDAHFQIYTLVGVEGHTSLVKDAVWGDERAAIFQFNEWQKEKEEGQ